MFLFAFNRFDVSLMLIKIPILLLRYRVPLPSLRLDILNIDLNFDTMSILGCERCVCRSDFG